MPGSIVVAIVILCLILMEQQNVLGSSVGRFGLPAFGTSGLAYG